MENDMALNHGILLETGTNEFEIVENFNYHNRS